MTTPDDLLRVAKDRCIAKLDELRGHRDLTPEPIYNALSHAIMIVNAALLAENNAVPNVAEQFAMDCEGYAPTATVPNTRVGRVGLPLLYNIVCLHRQVPKDTAWWTDFNELMRLADKLLYEQGYEISPYTTNQHKIAADTLNDSVAVPNVASPGKTITQFPMIASDTKTMFAEKSAPQVLFNDNPILCRIRCYSVPEAERCAGCPSRLPQAQQSAPAGGPAGDEDETRG